MASSRIKIGVVGLGTVGLGVVRALRKAEPPLGVEVARAADISPARLRASGLPPGRTTTDYREILNDPDIRIVCELVGGTSVARDVVEGALAAGKHLVTANKALLAQRWREVFSLARRQRRALGFESSVMAGVPVIRGIRDGLAGNEIRSLLAILNGTSNFVLTRMSQDGMEFSAALALARERGFAEADATLDIDGYDAAQKLAILGSIVLGRWLPPDRVFREGIGHLERCDLEEAREMFGYVIRPLAIFKQADGLVEARVHPTFVPAEHRLASIRDEFNAALVTADLAGGVTFAGRGAGAGPAASGVISDVLDIARAIRQSGDDAVIAPPPPAAGRARVKPMRDVACKFYLRFSVVDKPGVLSFISGALGRCGVSIASCHQRGRSEKGPVAVVMITHHAREGALRRALDRVDRRREFVKRKTIAIRIED